MNKVSGGNFIVMGVPGETVDEATAAIIRDVQPSGFILFARNMKSAEQVRALTDQLRTLVDHEPIICIDEEGGRVSRLRPILRVASPSASALRDCQNLSLVKRHGMLTASMLRMLGLNLNLAPVLDIELTPGAENSLRGRHYGVDAEQVALNAEAFIKGMRKAWNFVFRQTLSRLFGGSSRSASCCASSRSHSCRTAVRGVGAVSTPDALVGHDYERAYSV